MVVLTFGVLAYVTGRVDYSEYLLIPFIAHGGELAIFCFAIAGACVGFLWFNVHPAEIFMGDTGSLSLGAAVGTIALLIKKELLLVVCGAVFVIEALSVILQVLYYKSTKKRLFRMAPLHHHFELLGWPESKLYFDYGSSAVCLPLSVYRRSKFNNMTKRRYFRGDLTLLLSIVLLFLFGSVSMLSASLHRSEQLFGDPFFLFRRHLLWAALGLPVAIVVYRTRLEHFERLCRGS